MLLWKPGVCRLSLAIQQAMLLLDRSPSQRRLRVMILCQHTTPGLTHLLSLQSTLLEHTILEAPFLQSKVLICLLLKPHLAIQVDILEAQAGILPYPGVPVETILVVIAVTPKDLVGTPLVLWVETIHPRALVGTILPSALVGTIHPSALVGTLLALWVETIHPSALVGTIHPSALVGTLLALLVETIPPSALVGTLLTLLVETIPPSALVGTLLALWVGTIPPSAPVETTQPGARVEIFPLRGQVTVVQPASCQATPATLGKLDLPILPGNHKLITKHFTLKCFNFTCFFAKSLGWFFYKLLDLHS